MAILPTVYWMMALVGTLTTILMLFLGHGAGGGHDAGVGHGLEHGGLGHGGEAHGGAGHAHADQGRDEGPGPISLRTILAFTGGWGWGGLIGWDVLRWGVLSVPFGLAIGLVMAIIIFRFSRFLYNQEATSTISEAQLVGGEGVVLTSIPAHGLGEIRLYAQGMPLKTLARAENDEPIGEGQRIIVVEELGGTLIVRPSQ